jgi:hypothetical protein
VFETSELGRVRVCAETAKTSCTVGRTRGLNSCLVKACAKAFGRWYTCSPKFRWPNVTTLFLCVSTVFKMLKRNYWIKISISERMTRIEYRQLSNLINTYSSLINITGIFEGRACAMAFQFLHFGICCVQQQYMSPSLTLPHLLKDRVSR